MATLNGILLFSRQLGDYFYRRDKKGLVRRKSGTHQLSENSKKLLRTLAKPARMRLISERLLSQ